MLTWSTILTHPQAVTIMFIGCALAFGAAEALRPRVTQPFYRHAWWTDLSLTLFNGVAIPALAAAITGIAATWLARSHNLVWFESLAGAPVWIQFPIMLVCTDFLYYWGHRLYHSWPPLWELHKVHHASETLDWLSSSRTHTFDVLISVIIQRTLLAPFGFSAETFGLYFILDVFDGMWTHANVAMHVPAVPAWVRKVVVTPEVHRWHHADRPETRVVNLAQVCAFWDVLFGTHYVREGERPEPFGIADRPAVWHTGFFGLLLGSLRDCARTLRPSIRARSATTADTAG
jgi:sterol desaturase/sphingolipid hydroxylase (fatty acid hydroxylase superfamily)